MDTQETTPLKLYHAHTRLRSTKMRLQDRQHYMTISLTDNEHHMQKLDSFIHSKEPN